MKRQAHRPVIVTGGSQGIGAAIVRELARRSVPVCLNYNSSAEAAEKLAKELRSEGADVSAVRADMNREEDIQALFATAEERHGRPGALVNNAGYVGKAGRLVEEAEAAVLHQTMSVNVVAPFLCARELLRHILPRNGGDGGRIVNISSIAARTGSPRDWVDYAASKAALDAFTIGLAKEVGAEKVRVNGIAPGIISTEIHQKAGAPDRLERFAQAVPLKRIGTAEEVADLAAWLLLDAPDYVTGTTIEIGGGL